MNDEVNEVEMFQISTVLGKDEIHQVDVNVTGLYLAHLATHQTTSSQKYTIHTSCIPES